MTEQREPISHKMFHALFSRFGRPAKMPFAIHLFFFNDTATTEIYTLSLHDALPILLFATVFTVGALGRHSELTAAKASGISLDRKSTRLNSSHPSISYAVFCLK